MWFSADASPELRYRSSDDRLAVVPTTAGGSHWMLGVRPDESIGPIAAALPGALTQGFCHAKSSSREFSNPKFSPEKVNREVTPPSV